jgi:transcriptional regulator with XRE-family HTH domain
LFSYNSFEKILEERNISAYKVGKETGVATATLSSWKTGKYTPKVEKLQKIANYFGVSIEYFLEKQEDKQLAN